MCAIFFFCTHAGHFGRNRGENVSRTTQSFYSTVTHKNSKTVHREQKGAANSFQHQPHNSEEVFIQNNAFNSYIVNLKIFFREIKHNITLMCVL